LSEEWLKQEFDRCKSYIQRALDQSEGGYELEHVWDLIEKGRAQLWPTPGGCMVTIVDDLPNGLRVMRGWLAGGDSLKEIQASCAPNGPIETWARQAGCKKVIIGGRRGWLRAFTGYRELMTVSVKEL
jgi:hypothetical protein